MRANVKERSVFWWRWLVVVTVGVALFGISMVLSPNRIRQLFSLVMFSSPEHISDFGEPAVAYISLTHAVMGAVMFGWAIALLFILFGPFRRDSHEAWLTLTVSLLAWFVPDTVYSLWSGFWQNAVLNSVFVVLFAIPLAATYGAYRGKRA
ncbi:MAG TPA: hypothetical protein VFU22_01610 [Roseiflexaceae bacterium]|nr:hypothetical protein [Roseiflexaceae bacterium]